MKAQPDFVSLYGPNIYSAIQAVQARLQHEVVNDVGNEKFITKK